MAGQVAKHQMKLVFGLFEEARRWFLKFQNVHSGINFAALAAFVLEAF